MHLTRAFFKHVLANCTIQAKYENCTIFNLKVFHHPTIANLPQNENEIVRSLKNVIKFFFKD